MSIASTRISPRALPPLPVSHTRARLSHRVGDFLLHGAVGVCAFIVLALIAGIVFELIYDSRLALSTLGFRFFTSQDWNPVEGHFGALSSIYGTVISTAIAMIIVVPLSLAISMFLVELAPRWLSTIVGQAIELLAAIPSIIYGMWGLFVFAPFVADHIQPALVKVFGDNPLLSGPPMGIGMLTAGVVLALMVLPFMTAITRDVMRMTPPVLRESAFGLGSTTWEVVWKVMIPYGRRGILGGAFLALGRALGETMAVTFVIGNAHNISASLFAPGNTISSTLANEFTEASEPLYLSALIELGLVLMGITLVVQMIALVWLRRMSRREGRR